MDCLAYDPRKTNGKQSHALHEQWDIPSSPALNLHSGQICIPDQHAYCLYRPAYFAHAPELEMDMSMNIISIRGIRRNEVYIIPDKCFICRK